MVNKTEQSKLVKYKFINNAHFFPREEDTIELIQWQINKESNLGYSQTVGKIFEVRHYQELIGQKCRGQSFFTLKTP
jgi:hypothetical protein